MTEPFRGQTVAEAKRYLVEHQDDGADCPACGTLYKAYSRKITGASAATLIRAWRIHGHEPFHVPSFDGVRGGDFTKLQHWGLIQEERVLRPDGGRAGWWAITAGGADFARGYGKVRERVVLVKNVFIEWSGPLIDVRHALGAEFDFDELMGRRIP